MVQSTSDLKRTQAELSGLGTLLALLFLHDFSPAVAGMRAREVPILTGFAEFLFRVSAMRALITDHGLGDWHRGIRVKL
jgi:hypothetical protein